MLYVVCELKKVGVLYFRIFRNFLSNQGLTPRGHRNCKEMLF